MNLKLIILFTIIVVNTEGQVSLAFEFGQSNNFLIFKPKELKYSDYVNDLGFIFGVQVNKRISETLSFHIGLENIQKNYVSERLYSHTKIYERNINNFAQIPLGFNVKKIKINRFQIEYITDFYLSYWLVNKKKGIMPNLYSGTYEVVNNKDINTIVNLSYYSYDYSFDKIKDNRISIGFQIGLCVRYAVNKKSSFFVNVGFDKSLISQEKKYMLMQKNVTNLTFSYALGYEFDIF